MKTSRIIFAFVLASTFLLLLPGGGRALPRGTKVQTYKGGLNFPIDMAWVEGTRKVFFTEKSGAIRVMKGRKLLTQPCATMDVNDEGESGLLGIALHPKFKRNHKLYVFYKNASPLENRVARFIVERDRCVRKRDVLGGLGTTSGYHNGGQLEFVDGKLFVSVGEAHDPALAQNTKSKLGKILRINANGSIPKSNPFNNAVWSYGHRNPFGLAHKPGTSRLYSTENGPDCDDELNLIRRGRNYGWGSGYDCGTAGVGPNPKGPLLRWSSVIVPTDPWWYRGRMKSLSNSLYLGDHGRGALHRILMNDRGTKVRRDRVIYDGAEGINEVSKGPGGRLYFLTTGGMYRIVPE